MQRPVRQWFLRGGDQLIPPNLRKAHVRFGLSDNIEATVAEMQEIMRKASRDLLGGFELRADCKPKTDITRYPGRFIDKREREDGMAHWNWLMELIGEESEDGRSAYRYEDAAETTTTISEESTEDTLHGAVGEASPTMDDGITADQECKHLSTGTHDFIRGV